MSDLLASHDNVARFRIKPGVVATGFVVTSIAIFLLNTRHGIGILPDSVAYMQIGVARHFAPFYTWVLQAVAASGIDIVAGAKVLGLVLVGLNTFLTWQLILEATGSIRYAAAGTALIIASPVFVRMHSVAMSEPLFITLLLVALFTFVKGIAGRRLAWFATTGAVLGANMLTRFAAAPAIGALCLARLMHADRPFLRRLTDSFAIGVVSVVIFGAWAAASQLATGSSTGRVMAFRGDPDAAVWLTGLDSLSILLLPAPVPPGIRLAFLGLAAPAYIWVATRFARQWLRRPGSAALDPWFAVAGACVLFVISYIGFLVLTVYVQAYNVPLDGRAYLPLYMATVVSMTIMAARCPLPRRLSVTVAAVAAVVFASHMVRTAVLTSKSYANGVGYVDQAWASSSILGAVSQLPADARLYSNAPDVITFRLHRQAEYIPNRFNHITGSNEPLAPQMAALREGLRQAHAYLVFVDRVDWRFYQVPEKELVDALSVTKIVEESDGRIYQIRPGS